MSYILGALRKAEQERKRESELDMTDWDSAQWNSLEARQTTSPVLKIALVVIIVLLIAILVVVGRLLTRSSPAELATMPTGALDVGESSISTHIGSQVETSLASTDIEAMAPEQQVVVTTLSSAGINEDAPSRSEVNLPMITGHLYFPDNDSLSRIFTDSGSYRVGHLFDDGLILRSISEGSAVFDWQGQRYEVSLRNQ